jgi:tRNA(Leu) C34 or U34 (ribose-2'-O)-methylase TrmL
MAGVRCPRCESVFELPSSRLGRNVLCPACGGRMTARPLEIEQTLRRRARTAQAGAGVAHPRLPLVVLVDNVRSLWNVGSIFRTADAFAAERLVLCGITGCPPRPQIAKTALGAEQVVPWRYEASAVEALEQVRSDGYSVVALETTAAAVSLEQMRWPRKVCLVLGNEVAGVSPQLLERADHHLSIPMLGVKDSLNVAVAFGIAAHHAARALASVLVLAVLLLVVHAGAPLAAEPASPPPASPPPASPPATPLDTSAITGPTIEKVWYRSEKKTGITNPFAFSGDLILGERALQLKAKEKKITIPMEAIHVFSYGKMEGDVDTDWVVLGLRTPEGLRLVGMRDGRKLGYGQRTEEIREAVREALKRSGAAQYKVPAGYRTYEALESQLTLAMPQSWTGYILSLVMAGERARAGTIVFTEKPVLAVERAPSGELKSKEDHQALDRVLAGEALAFFLEKEPAAKGVSCKGLSQEAVAKLMERARNDALLGPGGSWLEPPHSEPATLDRCAGLRIQGRARRADGREVLLDLRAAAHGETLYLFGLRAPAADDKGYREPFETAIASIRFSVAR